MKTIYSVTSDSRRKLNSILICAEITESLKGRMIEGEGLWRGLEQSQGSEKLQKLGWEFGPGEIHLGLPSGTYQS